MVQNKGLIFKAVPTGMPVEGEHLTIESRPFDPSAPPPPNGLTTQNHYISYDPYQRPRMRPMEIKSYFPAFPLGAALTNRGIAKVLSSNTPAFQPGDLVIGMIGTEEYSIVDEASAKQLRKLDNPRHLAPPLFLGPLGMPGLTAYSSFYEIGQPKRGETILISAAAGAVGQLVGQLAKHAGLRVIGSVGSDDKLRFIQTTLGFDGGWNYKTEPTGEALKRLAPDGLDIYYDNVGGEQLEAAIGAMNDFGRIVACGMVSQYNLPLDKQYAVKGLANVVGKRLTIRGFIVSDPGFGSKYSREHQEKVAAWIADGTLKAQLSETEGIDEAAKGFIGMLEGRNFGKAYLKIRELEQVG